MENNIRNFAWPITSISKENYKVITEWAQKYNALLKQKGILIFGAGIRGTELSVILESVGYKRIIFTDNNSEKWGGYIDQYPIISIDEAIKKRDEVVYLISVEEGDSICKQLEEYGLVYEKDYFFPKPDLYDKFVNEYKRQISDEILVMGDCMFEVVSFMDENKASLSDMLYQEYGDEKIKLLTMHGMSLPGFYHMFIGQLNSGMVPRTLVLMLNFETLTGKQHLLPRSQHTKLVRAAYEISPDPTGELERYVEITEERVKNVQAEFFTTNNYSSQNNKKGNISNLAAKTFFKMNYLYKLDTEFESMQYLRMIMKIAKEKNIHVVPFVPPVNYQRGSDLFGEEFEEKYNNNLEKLKYVVREGGFELLDMSHICTDNEFADTTTPDETTNYWGRIKILNGIKSAVGDVWDE